MVVGMLPVFVETADAATTLTISQPDNWEYISKSNAQNLKWNKISGAAGYTVTVKNDSTGEYYTQNEWTTKNYYSLSDLFADTLSSSEYPRIKIWVGAMQSTDISKGLVSLDAQDSIIAVVSEYPSISISSASSVTSNGATLKMSVTKNYGSSIKDAGFYIGTSSSKGSASKYSIDDYGPSSVVNSGNELEVRLCHLLE